MTPWKETQRFADKTILLIVAIPLLASFFIAYRYNSSTSFIIVAITLALIVLLILLLKLEVRIDAKGIYFKYFPFHTTERHIPWENVSSWKIAKVNALKDYGGIGIRYTSKKKGFIINSKFGLEIEQTDERIIVLSISQQEAAEAALRYFSPQS